MSINRDWLTFTDGLGRTAVSGSEAGDVKCKKDGRDRKVGMFYWTWFNYFSGSRPLKIKDIISEFPDAKNDFDHKAWKIYNENCYFWDEPVWGYYRDDDPYVFRKQAELLALAGVDFVVFDCTNGSITWEDAYMNLLNAWSDAKKDGVEAPQIAFMLPFFDDPNANISIHRLWDVLYSPGKYRDMWYCVDGKPLLMVRPGALNPEKADEAEILDFFTFRAPYAPYFGDDMDNYFWGWLHVTPQACFLRRDGSCEMTTVGVAHNADYETMQITAMNGSNPMGRSYSRDENYKYSFKYKGKTTVCSSGMESSVKYGINFQEQWDYAISKDPDIIFVTGWNEWLAQRFRNACNTPNAFQDEYTDEYSRDIEPTKGPLKDSYYCQLVSNIRRFKGMESLPAQEFAKTIDIGGDIKQWDDSRILMYNSYRNSAVSRDAAGFSGEHYVTPAAANTITSAKVSFDDENIYFYAETEDNIVRKTGDANMCLLLSGMDIEDAAASDIPDWEGFQYIIGRKGGSDSHAELERNLSGWNWEKLANVRVNVQNNVMQVEIPRKYLHFAKGDRLNFRFKWADGNIGGGDVMDLYTDGCAFPAGRFAYEFKT